MVRRRLCLLLAACLMMGACGKSDPVISTKSTDASPVSQEPPPPVLPAEPWLIEDGLLTDPILQLPAVDSVRVVWYTSFAGSDHLLRYGPEDASQAAVAESSAMTRMLEDAQSEISPRVASALGEATASGVRTRSVWRHVAVAQGLRASERVPYQVECLDDAGRRFRSDAFTMQPLPAPGQPALILLTSDQQNQPMSAANYEKVVETIGQPDAVLFAGDMVDHPNRASEWFDRRNPKRPAFYPVLQGRLSQYSKGPPYGGGAILQHAPLFGALGNHDVSGRWQPEKHDIATMFNDPQPEWVARFRHADAQAIQDHSFEAETYEAMWDHPTTGPQGERYWAYRYGDTFIISLHINRIWRMWGNERKGKLGEAPGTVTDPESWGFGDHLFDPFGPGSPQYQWLTKTLQSEAFQEAKYKIVMAHQSMFGLGENAYPVLAEPEATLVYDLGQGPETLKLTHPISKTDWEGKVAPLVASLQSISYHYPVEKDVWRNAIEPLLLNAGVQLVLGGHSHLWNRAKVGAMHYLESSNVGNSFGARYEDKATEKAWPPSKRPPGDPHGRNLVPPNQFNPMQAWEGYANPLPFVAGNRITVFSVFATEDGNVKSYAFDTSKPGSEVKLMDVFMLEK